MSSNDPPLTPGDDGDHTDEPSWEPTSEMPVVPPDAPLPDPADGGPAQPLPASGAEPTEPVSQTAGPGTPDGAEPTAILPATGGDGGDGGDGASSTSESDLSLTQQLARRRVSHRRYVMRRVAVASVLVLLVGAAIAGIVLLAGDDDGDETAATVPDSTPVTEPVALPTTTTGAAPTSTTKAPIAADPTEPGAIADATEPDETQPDETEPDATTAESTDLGHLAAADTDSSDDEPETTEPDTTEPEATEPEETEPDQTEPGDSAATETSVPSTTEGDELVYDLSLEPTCEMRGGAKVDQAGADVECLEERLMQITDDALDLDVDRIFDDATDAAVRAFQEHFGLTVDGVVGPETASKLGIWPGSWPPDTSVTDTTDAD